MSAPVDFPTIYATDLLYVPECWKLCGNAHCCNFSRTKARFKFLSGPPAQELPLLPGEYAYLEATGALAQFQDHSHRVVTYPFGARTLRLETIISRRAGCACDHGTRPTVCRLYPFLPLIDATGALTGLERLGVHDLLEDLEGAGRICQIDTLPEAERPKLEAIVAAITRNPLARFYLGAYAIAQAHVRERLPVLKGTREADYFSVFEMALLRGRLIDHEALAARLEAFATEIEARDGVMTMESGQ